MGWNHQLALFNFRVSFTILLSPEKGCIYLLPLNVQPPSWEGVASNLTDALWCGSLLQSRCRFCQRSLLRFSGTRGGWRGGNWGPLFKWPKIDGIHWGEISPPTSIGVTVRISLHFFHGVFGPTGEPQLAIGSTRNGLWSQTFGRKLTDGHDKSHDTYLDPPLQVPNGWELGCHSTSP